MDIEWIWKWTVIADIYLLSTYNVQAPFQALHILTHLLLMTILGGDTVTTATLKVREMRQRLLTYNIQSHHMLISYGAKPQMQADWLQSPHSEPPCCIPQGNNTMGYSKGDQGLDKKCLQVHLEPVWSLSSSHDLVTSTTERCLDY